MKANHWFYGQPHGFHDPHQIANLIKQGAEMNKQQIEPRDRDGFLAKDRPYDHEEELKRSDAHEAALQDALNERDSIAYQSIGILRAMWASGVVPYGYNTSVTGIVADYDAINDNLVAILAKPK